VLNQVAICDQVLLFILKCQKLKRLWMQYAVVRGGQELVHHNTKRKSETSEKGKEKEKETEIDKGNEKEEKDKQSGANSQSDALFPELEMVDVKYSVFTNQTLDILLGSASNLTILDAQFTRGCKHLVLKGQQIQAFDMSDCCSLRTVNVPHCPNIKSAFLQGCPRLQSVRINDPVEELNLSGC